jgi:hypothetical protein
MEVPASRIQQDEKEPQRKTRKKARTWEESFRALVTYKETRGDCNVPKSYHNDPILGAWVRHQRGPHVATKLTQDQRERLDRLGFDWESVRERQDREWDEKFQSVKEYKRQHLDCCVPKDYTQDPELGKWVHKQRADHSQSRIPPKRLAKLESIGFSWSKAQSTRDTSKEDKQWLEKYDKLVDFGKEHGHCNVPRNYEKDKSLGMWVNNQRTNQAQETLRQDRKDLLDNVGFVWWVGKADAASLTRRKWDKMFERLCEFKQSNGHANVPQSLKKWGLGSWVSKQRAERRNGQLDPQRSQRLLEIGFTWGMNRDERWNATFEKLKAYKEKNGHCRLSAPEDHLLRNWMYRQRNYQEKGTLLPERKTKLDAFLFAWRTSKRRESNSNGTGKSQEEKSEADMKPRNVHKTGLDYSKEEKENENLENGLEESVSSDEEFEFEG